MRIKFPKMNKQERNRIKQILIITVLGWFLIIGFNYLIELPGSKADQLCPITDTVHGTVTLQPENGNNVIDCSAQDVVIASDGELVVERYYTANGSRDGDGGTVLLVRNLTVEAGGKITATGKGYQPGETDNGTGNGANALGQTGGSGGGYGGAGGEGVTDGINQPGTPGVVYGGQENPRLLGGAGGNTGIGGVGGAGGGNIELIVSEILTVNGVIEADGLEGSMSTDNVSTAGGGAGGSILIEAGSLSGSGSVSARGAGSQLAQFQGGGGGGGRVQMFCSTVNNFTGQVSVTGGETSNSQDGGTGSKLGPTCRPSVPTILKQYKLNLTTEIPVGGATAESSFYLAGNLEDPDSYDLLYLEVEVRAIGTAFSNSVTHSQTSGYPNPQLCTGTGTTCGKINVTGLVRSKEYHWQVRVRDNHGGYSAWVSYGGNDESAADIQLSGQAYSVALIQGNNQSGIVNTQLNERLGIRVVDINNLPVAGFVVTWSVSNGANGGALLESLSTVTNSLGEAFNTYRLGKNIGSNSITLTANGLLNSPLIFSESGLPDVIHHFAISSPDVVLVNSDFNIVITAYDQFNNLKTDYSGTVNLSPVSPLDLNQTLTGLLTPDSVIFNVADNGRKELPIRYDTVSSIKIKALEGLINGYSNTIAIIDQLGSCPDADGIIDSNQNWTADISNNGIFDCRNVPNPRGTGIIDIINGAILTLTPYQDGDTNYSDDFGVTILANSLQVEATSTINSDYLGYPATKGPGSNGTAYDGASYGGYNGDYSKSPYGTIYEPYQLGSGAGNDAVRAGAGGGSLKLLITNELLLNGVITANGGAGLNVSDRGGGGGSGGSVWVDTDTINGTGTIKTNGGEGKTQYWERAGAGAGGRIAIYYSSGSFPITNPDNIQARGGINSGDTSLHAGPGTIYLEQKGIESSHNGRLMIDNNNINGKEAGLLEDSYEFTGIILKRYGHVKVMGQNSHLILNSGSDIIGDSTRSKLGPNGTLTYTGGLLNIDGWTLNVQGKIEGVYNLNIGSTLQGGMTLYGNTWAYNNDVRPIFGTINVNSLGLISAYPYQNSDNVYTDEYGVTLEATILNIATGGIIESNEKGYPATKGPGSNGAVYDGASHGGFNGDNNKSPYDSTYEPSMLGSGGGDNSSRGGAGGGAIKLLIYSELTNNGTISANGGAGKNVSDHGGGGGSGGSIWIDTATFNGSGLISANGGNGRREYWDRSGGGGGGRVALYYSNGDFPVLNSVNIQAKGGENVGGAFALDPTLHAGPGTIYIEQKSVDPLFSGKLFIDNNNIDGKEAGLIEGVYQFGEIILKRFGHLQIMGQNSLLAITSNAAVAGDATKPRLGPKGTLVFTGDGTFNIDGYTLTIYGKVEGLSDMAIGTNLQGGLNLYANTWAYNKDVRPIFGNVAVNSLGSISMYAYQNSDAIYTDEYGVTFEATGLNIAVGGIVEANEKGYPATKGPGSNGAVFDGASHGGYNGDNNKSPYGDVYEPLMLGSGGGDNASRAGAGGGALKFVIYSELINNGTISANGGAGKNVSDYGGGGGSGGSVWIDTATLDGNGLILANGGNGKCEYWDRAGGGGGGRIAIYYNGGDFPVLNSANVQARGGINAAGTFGDDPSLHAGPGTIYIEQKGIDIVHAGSLLIDNNNVIGKEAGLIERDYKFKEIMLKRYGHLEVMGQDSFIELTSNLAVSGDATKPRLGPRGTLAFTGGGVFNIDGYSLTIYGKVDGITDIDIGTALQGGLIIYSNTWAYNKDVHPVFGTINVNSLGSINIYPYQNNDSIYSDDYGATIEADVLNIATGGIVESNEKGYPATKGPGSNGAVFDGASHGGYNGDNNISPYDDIYQPIMLGSGGGNSASRAGAGGGAFKLIISSYLSNNGIIAANGGKGINVSDYGGGGGSGGSIWIDTSTIDGNGQILANGGSGKTEYFDRAGGGGGGRIAIYYTNGNYPILNTSNVQARGGINAAGTFGDDPTLHAGPGTIYVEQKGVNTPLSGKLLIDNNNVDGKNAGLLQGAYTFNRIILTKFGHLEVMGEESTLIIPDADVITGDATKPRLGSYGTLEYTSQEPFNIDGFSLYIYGKIDGVGDLNIGNLENGTLALYAHTWAYDNYIHPVFNDVTINDKGVLLLYPYILDNAEFNDDYGVTFEADNLSISAGGHIDANYKGYPVTKGPGSNGNVYNGASHGGFNGEENKSTYGSIYEPSMLGSGAGDVTRGGAGGGAIKLIVNSQLLNNGTISAVGGSGLSVSDHGGGGGSGGSIWIDTEILEGNGLINANGGNGKTEYWDRGGAGGGGRIAIYYNSGNFPLADVNKVQARGGINAAGIFGDDPSLHAGPGTVFIKQKTEVYGSLYIFNNSITAETQDFNAIDYSFKDLKIGDNVITKIKGDTDLNRGSRFTIYGDFFLGPGAIINGIGRGFSSNQGPGAGESGQNLAGGGGGANGGAGGAGQSDGTFQAQGGQAYSTENQMQPFLLGSGGGQSGVGALGGYGGGAFALDGRYGHIDLYGTIDVSGTNGLIGSPGGGGGAGGSILLIANTCNITGNLVAEGGDGGDNNFDGGGGGGGRISILVTSAIENCDASTAIVSVVEGFSSEGLIGQEGTYVGVSSLPQIQLDSQSKLTGELIPVGGVISDNQVRFTVQLSDPGASVIDPKNLVADFEVVETSGSFTEGVLGLSSVTSDVITVDSTDPSLITVSLTSGLTIGEDYMWRARVRNVDLGTVSEWSEFGDNGTYPDFSISSTQSIGVEVDKTEVEIGEAIAITVSALDGDSLVVPNYMGTVSFAYSPLSDPGPNLPSNYTFSAGDSGVHIFNDELMFFSPGDYQVIVTDVNNPSITGTSVWITVLAPPVTPTPTPTETPIPSVTPYGDETTPIPSPTTDNVLVSLIPTTMTEEEERDCFEDPLQAKCQVNVVISNVKVTVDNASLTSEICFDTNIATVGVIKYGTESYTDSSEVEKTYRVKGHCITLDNLASAMGYIFKIEALSYAGKRGSYEGTFVTEGGVTPVVVEPKECIVINSTSFTDDHRAVLDYETSGPALCQVSYGPLGSDYAEIYEKETEELIKHRSYLNIINVEPYSDLMYRILCEVKDGEKINSCEAMDVISWNKIKMYYPDEGYRTWQTSELVGRIGDGLPFVGISFLGMLLVANLFAFPQLPIYGLFILRRKKRGNPWGVVFDKEKKIPVSFAVLRLYDTNGKLIEQSVSSLDGKYGFIVDEANYRLEVVHSDYSTTVKDINIQTDGEILSEDIPLTRKVNVVTSLTSLKNNIASLNKYLIYLGFALSIVAFVITPELLNGAILFLYLMQFVYLIRKNNRYFGFVFSESEIKGIQGAFVRLFDENQGRQLEVALTDKKGRYRLLVDPGQYLLKVDLDGFRMADQNGLVNKFGENFIELKNEKRYITRNVVLKRTA